MNITSIGVFCRAAAALHVETLHGVEAAVPAGAVFAADPATAARAFRAGLVQPIESPDGLGLPLALRAEDRAEVEAVWRRYCGAQFMTDLRSLVVGIERLPEPLPTAPPIVLNLGLPDPPAPGPAIPRAFRTAD